MSTATTLSSDPAPWGLARLMNDAITIMMATAMTAGMTILAGGRFFFAVPYSSPMLIVGPEGGAGTGGGGGGADGCSGMVKPYPAILRHERRGCDQWAAAPLQSSHWLKYWARLPDRGRRCSKPARAPIWAK